MNKKQPSNSELLYDVSQAADFLGVNPGTIRRWAQSKTISGVKVGVRGDWRFTKENLLQMAKGNIIPDELQEQKQLITNHASISQEADLSPTIVVPYLDWKQINDSEHFVQFYESDSFLLDSLSKFIGMGLLEGDSCIIIATKDHREEVEKRLKSYGLDLTTAQIQGQYVVLDSVETLSKFMVGDQPSAELFNPLISQLLTRVSKSGRKIRAFGEMVAYLWANGNQAGAIQLEELWNNIQKKNSFSLFCAYPINGFDKEYHSVHFSEVGTTHSSVIPSESYTSLVSEELRHREIALLQQKARSLEAEIEKRKKLEQQKDEFIALASHELKTPITSLKAFAQVLQKKCQKQKDKSSAAYLGKMDIQINKITTLIEDLLDITKIEAGKLSFHQGQFLFDDLVDEIIEEVQPTARHHKIVKKGTTGKSLVADHDRIGQVITNLLTNAIKYSPNSEKVILELSADLDSVSVSIHDFGIGISEEEQQYVFERFYREKRNGQETFPGLGLGLYISSEIIKRHNGRIWVTSKENKGSKFTFTLPLNA